MSEEQTLCQISEILAGAGADAGGLAIRELEFVGPASHNPGEAATS